MVGVLDDPSGQKRIQVRAQIVYCTLRVHLAVAIFKEEALWNNGGLVVVALRCFCSSFLSFPLGIFHDRSFVPGIKSFSTHGTI